MTLPNFMYALSMILCSWTLGLVLTAMIKNRVWYLKIANLNFITSETANKYLGINLTRTVIRKSFLKVFNPALKISKRSGREELLQLRKEMTNAEIGHLIAFILIVVLAIVFSFSEKFKHTVLPLLLLNILLNLYPSLLQQLNKRRLDKVLKA